MSDPEARASRASVPAAALAALAESGIVYLPLEVVARETTLAASGGFFRHYLAFAALFVAGTALATALRRSRRFGVAVVAGAVAVGVAQSAWWGGGGTAGALVAVGLGLAAGLRIATLALRDWRDPIQASFGWGAGVLLAEIVLASGAGQSGFLAVIAPQFFVASLASRAASVRLAEGPGLNRRDARRWTRLALGLAAAGGVLVGVAAVLGAHGGVLEVVVRVVPLAIYGLLYGLSFVALQALKPVGWVLGRIGWDIRGVQAVFARFRRRVGGLVDDAPSPGEAGAALWQRALGLALILAALGLLTWLIIRRRREWAWADRAQPEITEADRPAAPRLTSRRRGRRRRRELPEDAVRRWYAETLLDLERRGTVRPATATPGEFLGDVGEAHPDCAASFAALTRAYEDVRYGGRRPDPSDLSALAVHREVLAEAIHRAPRAP
jgi:Domain of unknown function (DUF4129)